VSAAPQLQPKEELVIIRDNTGVAALREYLKDKDIVALDTETTGILSSSEIIGYSVCAEVDLAFYVITAYWDVEAQQLKYTECKDTAADVMWDLIGKRLVLHNAVFDCQMIERNYGVSLIDSVFADTMIMAHLIDENRKVGLKELAEAMYGETARQEQIEMRESVTKNGGLLTKKCYELYKGDADLIAKYGAKDTILTLKVFYDLLPFLEEEGMTDFFFDDESMPLLRGPTYQMNTTGLKVDIDRLQKLKRELETEAAELSVLIDREITPHVSEKYPGTSKRTTFNIDSREQLAWLLFDKLNEQFIKVSNSGADLCRSELIDMRRPYSNVAKREFIRAVQDNKGKVWREKGTWDWKKKKKVGEAKVKNYWVYLSTDKTVLATFAQKYKWVDALLKLRKIDKLLGTYVGGILEKQEYGIIRPSFLQHGTTSGRYSSKTPNFQNLPRDDKRIKACIISRPGKVFVGADESQLEPRVFASTSQDKTLTACFASGEDFYSVVGAPIFGKTEYSLVKDDTNSFAKKFPQLRDRTKVIALATPYGRTAAQQASTMGISVDESQSLIDRYFSQYPSVESMMLESHEMVKRQGYVENLFGRKRRIPEAMEIRKKYGDLPHGELPYQARNLLNLAMNHRVQSTAASIVNRAAIRFLELCKEASIDAKIVLQVHDELVVECNEEDAEDVAVLLKEAMENTVELPGVSLVAEPKIGRNLAELK
jgi:DNA polymerase I-like protein with 3'-5' exonuclease and polymerase domains